MRRTISGTVAFPKGVHAVKRSSGKVDYYWQAHRGTKNAGPRYKLPDDPQSAEFWSVIRALRQKDYGVKPYSFSDMLDDYETSKKFSTLSAGTKEMYAAPLRRARELFGEKLPESVGPLDMREALDSLSEGSARNFHGVMRAVSKWAQSFGKIKHDFTVGISVGKTKGGHKPWSDAQIRVAKERLTGMVRRAFFLELYTGQRGSDVVRLHPGMIDDGGFRIEQQKTGREVYVPILPELKKEMATWPKDKGAYIKQEGRAKGKPYTRKLMDRHFKDQRDKIELLKDATMHGLRATAVINLRERGLTPLQIEDFVGMSHAMIARYCRFADKKKSGKAAAETLQKGRQGVTSVTAKATKRRI